MTVDHFKVKYPHLAHLEKGDLWNAMSKAVFIEQSPTPIKTKKDLEKFLKQQCPNKEVFEDRFKDFEILIPGSDTAKRYLKIDYKPTIKNAFDGPKINTMTFDEAAKWASERTPMPRAKKSSSSKKINK